MGQRPSASPTMIHTERNQRAARGFLETQHDRLDGKEGRFQLKQTNRYEETDAAAAAGIDQLLSKPSTTWTPSFHGTDSGSQ